MVRYVDQARAPRMIVATEKVALGVEHHVRSGHWNVLVPGYVHAPRVIDPVIKVSRNRERRDGALRMVRNVGYIGRKDGLIFLVHSHGHVGPPQKRLREWCSVIQTGF